jgi:hypothetical protein
MHIEVLLHPVKGYQVRIIDPEGKTRLMLTHQTLERPVALRWRGLRPMATALSKT